MNSLMEKSFKQLKMIMIYGKQFKRSRLDIDEV